MGFLTSSLASLCVVNLLAISGALGQSTDSRWIISLNPSSAPDLELHTRWISGIHARNIERRGGSTSGLQKTFNFPGFVGYTGSFDNETLETIRASSNVRF